MFTMFSFPCSLVPVFPCSHVPLFPYSSIKDIRASLAGDEKTTLMLDALRGKNINDDDAQGEGVDMKVR
jgi:hypothetical protein